MFDESLRIAGEDVDLKYRLMEAQVPSLYVPKAGIRHMVRSNLLAFLKQQFNWGRGDQQLRIKSGQRAISYKKYIHFISMDVFRELYGRYGLRALLMMVVLYIKNKAFDCGLWYEKLFGNYTPPDR